MRRLLKLSLYVLALLAGFLAGGGRAAAQAGAIESHVFAGGGGMMTNAGTVVEATIGQSVIGVAAITQIEGWWGFWPTASPQGTSSVRITATQRGMQDLYVSVAPNPAATRTTITFDVEKSGDVQIRLFDLMGREIATLIDSSYEPGRHMIDVAIDELSSGSYLIELRQNGGSTSMMLVVMQ